MITLQFSVFRLQYSIKNHFNNDSFFWNYIYLNIHSENEWTRLSSVSFFAIQSRLKLKSYGMWSNKGGYLPIPIQTQYSSFQNDDTQMMFKSFHTEHCISLFKFDDVELPLILELESKQQRLVSPNSKTVTVQLIQKLFKPWNHFMFFAWNYVDCLRGRQFPLCWF